MSPKYIHPITSENVETIERRPILVRYSRTRRFRLKNVTRGLMTILSLLFLLSFLTAGLCAAIIIRDSIKALENDVKPIKELAEVITGDRAPEKARVVRSFFGLFLDAIRLSQGNNTAIPDAPGGKGYFRDYAAQPPV